jgi:hypothetical protein
MANGGVVSFTLRPLSLPGKEPPVPIRWEVGLTPEPVSTTWRKFLTLSGFELDPSVVQFVASRYTD